MRFKGLDLNLFVAFEALMETRNTARAGEKIGLSQPAASAALGRLRDYFDDDLLVLKGRRMYPTPLAETLRPRIRECLRRAEDVLATPSNFDPKRAKRHFRVIASDYVMAALIAPLSRHLATEAPGVTLQLELPGAGAAERLHRGEVDLVICPSEYAITGVPTELIYEEEYVIAGDGEHPLFRDAFAFDDLFDYGFVAVSVGSERSATVGERHFDLLGRARRIEITAPSFAAIPWMLVGTQRLALMHRRLAKLAAERFGLAFASLPGDFPPLRQLMHFHETRANDDGLAWLRARLRHTANAQD